MADVKTSEPSEYIETALSYSMESPMAASAMGVCDLRAVDAFENVWFEGHYMPRWRAVIIEGMLLHSIAEQTLRDPGYYRTVSDDPSGGTALG